MKTLVVIGMFLSMATAEAQEIYKTVDAQGNIIYTDVPPSPDAKPMALPPISVADPYELPPIPLARPRDASAGNPYGNVVLISPSQDESLWGTGGTVPVRVKADSELLEGDKLNFYLDDESVGSAASFVYRLTGVHRGTHTLRAEIVAPSGRVRAQTPSVSFHVHQRSVADPGSAAALSAPRVVPNRN